MSIDTLTAAQIHTHLLRIATSLNSKAKTTPHTLRQLSLLSDLIEQNAHVKQDTSSD